MLPQRLNKVIAMKHLRWWLAQDWDFSAVIIITKKLDVVPNSEDIILYLAFSLLKEYTPKGHTHKQVNAQKAICFPVQRS